MPMTRRVAVALGSNLQDRAAHIAYGVSRLRDVLHDLRVSRNVDTEPVGVSPQGRFLNAAAVGYSDLPAFDLLEILLNIERERGRERPFPGAPRTLDLDLLLVGDEIHDTAALVLPHPRFRERLFVLEPLAEVAPEVRDPVTGETVLTLLEKLRIKN
jgi:2-amino-4-hydroxy-6-hydroxymethyldihydropteridine diphosphokinase